MNDKITGTQSFDAQLTGDQSKSSNWVLPEECPISIRINNEIYAVMLATPLNLSDFALGFCLSEGLVKNADAILSISEKHIKHGLEIDIKITEQAYDRIQIIDRRRRLSGGSGCGVCGLTSISHIVEDLPKIESNLFVSAESALKAIDSLREHTPLNNASHSVHAAAFADENGNILLVREDVGRHNALDKLFGALNHSKINIETGFVILSSRFAYELAQKCIRMGVSIVVSISAPTSMATEMALEADMTYAAAAEDGKLMVFSAQQRLLS